MSDEYEDESEDQESEDPTQISGFESLPKETQAELKKLRKESRSLRTRLQERDVEVLNAKYGEDIVSMIPVEVTTFERRSEFAETLQARFAATAGTKEATEEAPSTQEEPTQAEKNLAVASSSQSAASSGPGLYSDMSATEIGKMYKDDPAAAFKAMEEKYADSI